MTLSNETDADTPTVAEETRRQLGRDLRALRKSKGLTLEVLAQHVDRSIGFLSQVERGLSDLSITDLRKISEILEVPVSFFLVSEAAQPEDRGYIVRAGSRRSVGSVETGIVEELLSPDLGGSFEIFRSVIAPGAALDDPITRDTEEAGYIVSGSFDLEINGHWYRLDPGDSFRFRGEPYRWRNAGADQVVVIWVMAPPVY